MPLPKPKNKEKKQEFISRCIAGLTRNKKDEFPSPQQRAAVCYSQWGETPEEKAKYAKRKKREKRETSEKREKK